MDAAVWGFIGVVLGGAITGWFTVKTESIRADKEATLESQKRSDDRRIDRDNFQRRNLLELQKLLAEWMRGHAELATFDAQTFKATGKITQVPREMSDRASETGRQLGYRIERVKDDSLRASLDHMTARAGEVQARRAVFHEDLTITHVEEELTYLATQYTEVQSQLGRTLREYL